MNQSAQQQEPPGRTGEMSPGPDHGEESYRGSGRLAGRAAVITGADSGIGRAVAIAFAREGADVLIAYLDEHEDARETARWVEQAGRRGGARAGRPGRGGAPPDARGEPRRVLLPDQGRASAHAARVVDHRDQLGQLRRAHA
jgi:NAD(P)-dependent dehydrogenase (short-subunit alcohol dehydrogenase family)